jgi:hypothetical protein
MTPTLTDETLAAWERDAEEYIRAAKVTMSPFHAQVQILSLIANLRDLRAAGGSVTATEDKQ